MPVLTNPRHERFCQELAKGKSADEAYQIAGFRANRGNASTLKTKQNVLDRVAELLATVAEKAAIDAAWVLRRLAEEAEADLADLYDDGKLRPISEWPLIWRKGLVAGLEIDEIKFGDVVTGHTKKLKLSDRIKRIELIGKHVGVQAFRENVGLTGKDGGPVQTEELGGRDLARRIALALSKGE